VRFGVRLPHFNPIAADARTAPSNIAVVARRAEELGFDSIWVGDHIVLPTTTEARFGNVWYEAMTTLAYVAAITEKIRLGTSVLVAPYRHPLLVAKMLATLDNLSHGRVEAGFGTGHLESEFRALDLDTFPRRGEVTDTYLKKMRAAWAGQVTPKEGCADTYTFDPRPVHSEGLPIWIGGNSRRAARRVAELGNGWMLIRPTHEDLSAYLATLHEVCAEASRKFTSIKVGVENARRFTDEPQDKQPFVGPPQHVLNHVNRFASEGAELVLFDMFYNAPGLDEVTIAEMLDGMEIFARDVMPHAIDPA
jgi:probable F420-dependent oxidoreductase